MTLYWLIGIRVEGGESIKLGVSKGHDHWCMPTEFYKQNAVTDSII